MKVFPNPWFGGRGPCAVVQYDMDNHRAVRGFVGATFDREICVVTQPATHQSDRVQGVGYLYRGIKAADLTPEKLVAAGPVEIPKTAYYCQRLRHHELIPADVETAKIGRVRWEDPVQVLRRESGMQPEQPQNVRRVPTGGDAA
jgi:hypothetical protein